MADTLVETDVTSLLDSRNGLWGPYWININTAIIVFSNGANDLKFARTTDKGATWATTEIEAGTVGSIAAWYDKETPGDNGTLVHIAWLDFTDAGGSEDAKYVTVNVLDGTVGTIRTIDGGLTLTILEMRIAITKTVNGNLIVAFSSNTEIECYRSTDAGANWTDRADVFETTTEEDFVLLFPADVDAGDAAALFWDRSADVISVKMYDDSANTWTETSISGSMFDDPTHIGMDGAIRHSDNHLLMAAHSDEDTTTDDILTWELTVNSIASPTVTAQTNVVTDQAESGQVSVFINQQNDDVYVAYLKGGTWEATVDVVFHISTDDMSTWGTEQAYSESAADDFRLVQAGRTVGNDGGRYQPSFYDDDQTDIYVNETNDVEIAAVSAAAFRPHMMAY